MCARSALGYAPEQQSRETSGGLERRSGSAVQYSETPSRRDCAGRSATRSGPSRFEAVSLMSFLLPGRVQPLAAAALAWLRPGSMMP
jgi:hypothetical protein